MVDGSEGVRPTTHGELGRELRAQTIRERQFPAQRVELFRQLGYRTVEGDVASNRQFATFWQERFPLVLGNRSANPDETNSAQRAKIPPPECTTLETPEGKRLWALSFGDRLTVVVDSQGTTRPNINETSDVDVLSVRHFLVGHNRKQSMLDLLPLLHSYENRWKRDQTEIYLSASYTDPYYFPGDGQERPYILLPFMMGRVGQQPVIDIGITISHLLHEGGHAARRVVDEQLSGSQSAKEATSERGAHAIGLLLAKRLGSDMLHTYRRFMRGSLNSYRAQSSRVSQVRQAAR